MPDEPAPTPAPPPPPPPPAPEPPPASQPAAALSPEQVDKLVAAESTKAKREALKALSDDLGMTIDEAKALVASTKAANDAQLSELEKREQAATKRETEANARAAEADARTRALAVKEALIDASVKPERRDYAATLVTLEADAGPDEIAAAVAKLATAIPEFFGATTESPRTPASVPTGGRPSPAATQVGATGREEAKRFLGQSRSSYFPENEKAGAPA